MGLENTVTIKTRKIDLNSNLDTVEDDVVAVEMPVHFYVNERSLTTIMASPLHLREMAMGFLLDEGIIKLRRDILQVTVDKNKVLITAKKINQKRCKSIRERGVIATSCSSRKDFFQVIGGLMRRPLEDDYQVTVTDILEMVKKSVKKSTLFKSTGGVHSASIFVDMSLRAFTEDVGRHNAVDKTIGICIDNDIPLERATLITSGRQTADIVIKAARCRIPISVSMRAPLSSGVYAAKLMGITLICFARGHRMNIYSTPQRIKSLY